MSLIKTIKAIESFANSHKQLNSFFAGSSFDFFTTENLYPALIVKTAPSVINQAEAITLKGEIPHYINVKAGVFNV